MKIQEILRKRDLELIGKYCQTGTDIDQMGQVINGVCQPIEMEDLLNDLHLHDAMIYEEIKKMQGEPVTPKYVKASN